MAEIINALKIKACENLPLDFTLYEKYGFCRKPNEECKYYQKDGDDNHLCNKKTYTLNQGLVFGEFPLSQSRSLSSLDSLI